MVTTALSYRLTGLTEFTVYSIQVAARRPTAGAGPFSNPVTAVIIGRKWRYISLTTCDITWCPSPSLSLQDLVRSPL